MYCTGYTSLIADGKINTAKDFLKVCLRQFGVLVDYRDEPLSADIPTKLKVSDFYIKQYKEAEKKLNSLVHRNSREWEDAHKQAINEAVAAYDNAMDKEKNEKYLLAELQRKIALWECSESFKAIKEFALEQLGVSKPDDSSFEAEKLKKLESITWEQYAAEQIADAQHKVDYSRKRLEEEKSGKAKQQEFLDKFLKEVENVGD
jgi:hypothetical protein